MVWWNETEENGVCKNVRNFSFNRNFLVGTVLCVANVNAARVRCGVAIVVDDSVDDVVVRIDVEFGVAVHGLKALDSVDEAVLDGRLECDCSCNAAC